jgi:NAD-dependent deacetylase
MPDRLPDRLSSMGAEGIQQLSRFIDDATSILVFTGAGISTASGIPDYRGPEGVWTTRRPVFYNDFMASASARAEYWRQKLEDRESFGAAEPNAVHRAVVRLERSGKVGLVVTQNVDGLHAEAGTSSERLVEVHGTNRLVQCQTCGARSDPAPHFATFAESGEAPRCACGGLLKPATISFGQQLRAEDITRAFEAAQTSDLVVALGSTLAVTPAADIPMAAARRGAPYVIVNQGRTEHDGSRFVTLRIEGDVSLIFPAAVDVALADGPIDPGTGGLAGGYPRATEPSS